KEKSNAKTHGGYLPTDQKIDETIDSCIAENIHKSTKKWVKALNTIGGEKQ
ncbi:12640_t:CDS:1, partial [Gigaspora rosea]